MLLGDIYFDFRYGNVDIDAVNWQSNVDIGVCRVCVVDVDVVPYICMWCLGDEAMARRPMFRHFATAGVVHLAAIDS